MRKPPLEASQLLSHGCYHYYRNNQSTGITEPWSVERNVAGDLVYRAERQSPEHGLKLGVWARQRHEAIVEFNVNWQQQLASSALDVRAYYEITSNHVQVQRQCNSGRIEIHELDLPAGQAPVLVSPLMRVFAGPVIAALLKQGGSGSVLLPFIADPGDVPRLLLPQISTRKASVSVASDAVWEGGPVCRCCAYEGDQYPSGTRFWLDENNLLQRYLWQQDATNTWDVRLEQLPE